MTYWKELEDESSIFFVSVVTRFLFPRVRWEERLVPAPRGPLSDDVAGVTSPEDATVDAGGGVTVATAFFFGFLATTGYRERDQ